MAMAMAMARTWRPRALATSLFGCRNGVNSAGGELLFWSLRSLSIAAGQQRDGLQVCIVGSGPAGFYTAEKVLKRFERANVDILDRLPTPFGLVRSGVAPDHPETKVVINQFSRVAVSDRCSYFGNVKLGTDISLEELRKLYDVVVLAYGAESDRRLGVPGEDLVGVHAAREFVWWYNGHPDQANLQPDLQSSDTAVILGQGNVALDCARILLRSTEELATTDIAEHALVQLRESRIRRVLLVGRRGPVQAACTAKELREIMGIKGLSVNVHTSDLVTSPADLEEMKVSRSHKRVYELFVKAAGLKSSTSHGIGDRELPFLFFKNPVEILPSSDGARVAGVKLEKTVLQGEKGNPQRAVGTGEFEDVSCGLVLKSIGYKSIPVPGLTFDHRQGVVPNLKGRVLSNMEGDSSIEAGLFVVGWLKRGPTGIIGTNLIDADETVESIVEDWTTSGLGSHSNSSPPGSQGLQALLEERCIPIVTFEDWLKIHETELELGLQKGKPQEKIVSKEDMLMIARQVSSQTGG
ncbi:hypothetical protein M758_7G077800 [Ceratodon purpureus]|nr:hypothetical protein M758_7G077800 [Ceratodon purpureus]KAG0610596.1 hypothetical protein M758_7G077800 [Ceratodon purpureus]KAG0610597.1 hypothetical protein M758_7G077800 [Ceratodon purpureus]